MVLPDSDRVSRARPYLGFRSGNGGYTVFTYGTITLCGSAFQRIPLTGSFVTPLIGPATPPGRSRMVWAVPFSLAATQGVAIAFLSSGY